MGAVGARRTRLGLLLLVLILPAYLLVGPDAAASSWTTALGAHSGAEAAAKGLPSAPTGVSAACSSTGSSAVISWNAGSSGIVFSVFEATSASGNFSTLATGVTGTSFTTGTLGTGDYWFEVAAVLGGKWSSALSSETREVVISTYGCSLRSG